MDTMLLELFSDSRDGGQREELERLLLLVLKVPKTTRLRWDRPGAW